MTKQEINNEEMKYIVNQAKKVVGGIILLVFFGALIYLVYGA